MKDLTLITCSYETPIVTETMLKSYVYKHGPGPHNVIVMENSRDNRTVEILEANGVPYVRTPGAGHSPSVDTALKICSTRYALLVDTDIIFNSNIEFLYRKVQSNGYALMGQVCGSRAGFNLYTRVHPWFCFIDVEKTGKFNFHDQERIDATDSNVFYTSCPLTYRIAEKRYDVGATFFEDIHKAGMKIGNLKPDPNIYIHYEGMSWYKNANIDIFQTQAKEKDEEYKKHVEFLRSVSIRGCFK